LKNSQKPPFIQQVADDDFALGASPLSWHKWMNQRPFAPLIRDTLEGLT
jgi:hypothetical protein